MAVEGKAIDALGQFELGTALGPIGASVGFTQSNLFMLISGSLIILLMMWGMRARAMVPGRMQSLAESAYGFIDEMVVSQVGDEGRRFFPFVFTLFMFILFGNMLGLFPYTTLFRSACSRWPRAPTPSSTTCW